MNWTNWTMPKWMEKYRKTFNLKGWTLEDIINNQLNASDPLKASLRKQAQNQIQKLHDLHDQGLIN